MLGAAVVRMDQREGSSPAQGVRVPVRMRAGVCRKNLPEQSEERP